MLRNDYANFSGRDGMTMTTTTNTKLVQIYERFFYIASFKCRFYLANPDYWQILSTGFNRRLGESSCNLVELLAKLLEILPIDWLNFSFSFIPSCVFYLLEIHIIFRITPHFTYHNIYTNRSNTCKIVENNSTKHLQNHEARKK